MARIDEPMNATAKAARMTFFSLYLSIRIPEGMDMTPYAMKKAKGRIAARPRVRENPPIRSGMSGPMIFVIKEITKNISKIRQTRYLLLFICAFVKPGWQIIAFINIFTVKCAI
jgi:hypothetical protein